MSEGVAAVNNVDTPPTNRFDDLDCDLDPPTLIIGTSVFVFIPWKGREERGGVWNNVS